MAGLVGFLSFCSIGFFFSIPPFASSTFVKGHDATHLTSSPPPIQTHENYTLPSSCETTLFSFAPPSLPLKILVLALRKSALRSAALMTRHLDGETASPPWSQSVGLSDWLSSFTIFPPLFHRFVSRPFPAINPFFRGLPDAKDTAQPPDGTQVPLFSPHFPVDRMHLVVQIFSLPPPTPNFLPPPPL